MMRGWLMRPGPTFPYEAWKDTCATLHMWTQIVGQDRARRCADVNHSWRSALYGHVAGADDVANAVCRGAARSTVEFDFVDHAAAIMRPRDGERRRRCRSSRGRSRTSIAKMMATLRKARDLRSGSGRCRSRSPTPIPFTRGHGSTPRTTATRPRLFWRILLQADRVLNAVPRRASSASSPVHFFWGGFDLAVPAFGSPRPAERRAPNCAMSWGRPTPTRSAAADSGPVGPGRRAGILRVRRPRAGRLRRRACGRGGLLQHANSESSCCLTRAVRTAPDPDAMLLAFMESTYGRPRPTRAGIAPRSSVREPQRGSDGVVGG